MKFVIDFLPTIICSFIWIGLVVFFRFGQKKSFIYLIFFTLFFIYIVKVFDYTLFQFQSLLILKHFMPNLLLKGVSAEKSINVIPIVTLTAQDLKTSFLNILLLVPFGFGLPFITNVRMKNIIILGFLFSITIELLQLITGLLAKMTFRVADINDVIFNTIGVAVGYILFVGFMRLYFHLTRNKTILKFLSNILPLNKFRS